MKKTLFILGFCIIQNAKAQFSLTPQINSAQNYVSVEVPAKFQSSFPAGKSVWLADGFKVRVFYVGGLIKPRFMCYDPWGVLHVSDQRGATQGKVYALPDKNNDGIADTMIMVAQGFTNNHDIKFYKGDLYVTESTKIWKCVDANKDGIFESKSIFISNVGDNTNSGHITRTIVFDSIRKKIYLSVGASCNVCREDDRAIIEEYNDDGTGKRTYSSGVRNAVGMALHPVTMRLWANNNGSDYQGNETPPEWVDIVRDQGFYGHPFAYADKQWFDFNVNADYQSLKPITAADSARVNSMTAPAALIRAHSAPMALEFLNNSFPDNMEKGFLMALRGSWNTTNPNDFRGYKVIYSHLSSDQDSTVDHISDFISGFLTDTINRVFWARPVGLLATKDGGVFMSSDEGSRFILHIYKDPKLGSNHTKESSRELKVYPNPASDQLSVSFSLSRPEAVQFALIDICGREISLGEIESEAGSQEQKFAIAHIPAGVYTLRLSGGNFTETQKLLIIR